MDDNSAGWQPTDIVGLEVRSQGAVPVAIRLHGWEAILPISLIQSTALAPEAPASRLVVATDFLACG